MNQTFNRRHILTTTATLAAGAALGFGSRTRGAPAASAGFKTRLRKAVIMNEPTEEGLQRVKDAGFDGVEAGVLPVADAAKCRRIADQLGMKIHSVMRGWAEFNSGDPEKVKATRKTTEDALRAAEAFGADAVLLVPCRVGGMKIPNPRELQIEFDEKTSLVSKVVAGDNAPYAAYIKAHNHATETSREQIKRLIGVAEKTGVVIALENVWNNLWSKPALFRSFVASFESPWVKAYFDIGNHVKYAPPEEWLRALGPLVAKCHAKDFKLNEDPGGNGDWANIRDGSVNWPAVREALETIKYDGWLTIEGGKCTEQEHSRRLDLIIAGK
ncbi:MAG: sugar phosphate isomerase/epimerase [Akkermansiaceae bacterium]|nr:sugar phosphate isomerase/epimerase [Akkermansiaceae bacterium]